MIDGNPWHQRFIMWLFHWPSPSLACIRKRPYYRFREIWTGFRD